MVCASNVHEAPQGSGGWIGSVSGFSKQNQLSICIYVSLSVYVFTFSLYMYLYKEIYFKELAYAAVGAIRI